MQILKPQLRSTESAPLGGTQAPALFWQALQGTLMHIQPLEDVSSIGICMPLSFSSSSQYKLKALHTHGNISRVRLVKCISCKHPCWYINEELKSCDERKTLERWNSLADWKPFSSGFSQVQLRWFHRTVVSACLLLDCSGQSRLGCAHLLGLRRELKGFSFLTQGSVLCLIKMPWEH